MRKGRGRREKGAEGRKKKPETDSCVKLIMAEYEIWNCRKQNLLLKQ